MDSNKTLNIRKNMIRVALDCKSKVHWGSSLSCVEILYALYGCVSNVACNAIPEKERDIIIVSKGQGALAMYATMYEVGMISDEFVMKFQANGSNYPEEIMANDEMRIPCSTGSLGLGLPYATGVALKKKRRDERGKVYVVVGDGECDEGSNWEAAMLASHYNLDNLTLIIDCNGLQADGKVSEVVELNSISQKFEAFGWSVTEADGHSCKDLIKALQSKKEGPHAIVATTVKGKGISFMENDFSWHDHILDKELLKQACKEVGIEYVGQ